MITPTDIQNKEFSRGVRGYNEKEVDMFLDLITLDLEKIVKENVRLKAEIAAQSDELARYKESEGEVVQVLEKAKALMNDIAVSTDKRAQVIMKNAELEADLYLREARHKAEKLAEENAKAERAFLSFRDKYRRLLANELEAVDSLADDFGVNEIRGTEFDMPKEEEYFERQSYEGMSTFGSGDSNDGTVEVRDMSDLDDIDQADQIDDIDNRKTVVVDLSQMKE